MNLKSKLLSAVAVLLVIGGCAAPGRSESPNPTNRGLLVVSSVAPITNIVRNIVGDNARVEGLIPEGVDSHTFEPSPETARLLSTADLIFLNGLRLEEGTLRIAESNKRPGSEIKRLGEATITPDAYIYDFSFPRAGGSPNPHLWMNLIYALRYAEVIAETMAERDPSNASRYRANLATFADQIGVVDAAIYAAIRSIPEDQRKLLTYHDSFAYFAPRYGLSVIGAVQPADFSEPSAQEIANLIRQIRADHVRAIFGSEVFPSKVLEQISRESGAKYVNALSDDELPGLPGQKDHSYLAMMVANVRTIATALGGDPSPLDSAPTENLT